MLCASMHVLFRFDMMQQYIGEDSAAISHHVWYYSSIRWLARARDQVSGTISDHDGRTQITKIGNRCNSYLASRCTYYYFIIPGVKYGTGNVNRQPHALILYVVRTESAGNTHYRFHTCQSSRQMVGQISKSFDSDIPHHSSALFCIQQDNLT